MKAEERKSTSAIDGGWTANARRVLTYGAPGNLAKRNSFAAIKAARSQNPDGHTINSTTITYAYNG
ncbi:hypothetical protein [Chitinophaga rhizosphaerae]|uniref:hypothetical protein n=1 Tax=Chitinophaga rhizosphaerae TaxID=1864947 RepID=UPI000F80D2A2|nr:hypothetical protein [Chitinophaga rhizosphaerae]